MYSFLTCLLIRNPFSEYVLLITGIATTISIVAKQKLGFLVDQNGFRRIKNSQKAVKYDQLTYLVQNNVN